MIIKKLASVFLFVLFISSVGFAQEANQDEQMKIWMDYMTPGQVHQTMATFAGDWKTENKMWMAPGTEPIVSEGACKVEMLLGGRYMKTSHTGNYMGMPFEGFSIEGYDKAVNEFNYVWIDNFGTGMMIMKGAYDQATRTLNYKGTMVDPVQKKEVPVRSVVTFLDGGMIKMEMFNQMNGQEFKSMEMNYKR